MSYNDGILSLNLASTSSADNGHLSNNNIFSCSKKPCLKKTQKTKKYN